MNKKTKRTYMIIVAIAILVVAIAMIIIFTTSHQAQLSGAVVSESKQPIMLGFISSLTGDAASYGKDDLSAATIAIEEINAQGGIGGRQLKLIAEDGKCSGTEASLAAQKLVNVDKVKIVLGGACSGETLTIAPITEAQKVILFSSFSSNPAISDAGDYVFRNAPTDNDFGPPLAELMIKDGYKKIAIITENTVYAQGLRKIFNQKVDELGGTIVADETFLPESKDFRAQISKLEEGNPQAIFLNTQTEVSTGLLARQIRESGIEVPFYGAFSMGGQQVIDIAGSAIENSTYVDAAGLTTPKGKLFLEQYTKKYGVPSSEYLIGASYDRVYILKGALEKCSEDTDCIKDYLYSIKDYNGVLGTYGFNEKGDMTGMFVSIKKIIDGKAVVIG